MYIYNDNKCYGELGVYTGYKDFYVGDIIHVEDKSDSSVGDLMIVYSDIDSRYSALGLLYLGIDNFEKDYTVIKTMSFKELTTENINEVAYFDNFELRKSED